LQLACAPNTAYAAAGEIAPAVWGIAFVLVIALAMAVLIWRQRATAGEQSRIASESKNLRGAHRGDQPPGMTAWSKVPIFPERASPAAPIRESPCAAIGDQT